MLMNVFSQVTVKPVKPLTKCRQCLNKSTYKFNNAVVTTGGYFITRSDILEEIFGDNEEKWKFFLR